MIDYTKQRHNDALFDCSAIPNKRLALPYPAPDGTERSFDLYYPDHGPGPFPVIVSISGGGWYYGVPSSNHLGQQAYVAVARGYAFASIACTSSKDKKFPYQIQEATGFIRFLRQQAKQLNLDPSFVSFLGASSGGHLSLMAALTPGQPPFDQADHPDQARVNAVAVIYPCCCLGATEEDFQAIGLESAHLRSGPNCMDSIFLGVPVEEAPELAQYASPITHIHLDAPPVFLLHGTADTTIPYTDSLRFASRYEEIAGANQIEAHFLPGAGHSDPVFKDRTMCHKILNFFDRVRNEQPQLDSERRQTAQYDL